MASSDIDLETLSKYFHLPMCDVAKELGICATVLKKICRKNGIPRWPHRKLKSIEKSILALEESISKGSDDKDNIKKEIESLKLQKESLIKDPSILVQMKEVSNFELLSSKKRQRDFEYSMDQSKRSKSTFDVYGEEYLVYCAEKTLTIFSKFTKEISSKKNDNLWLETKISDVEHLAYQKPFYWPVSSSSACFFPVFHPPFSNQHDANSSLKKSDDLSMTNSVQVALDYPIIPNPYFYYYQPKSHTDKAVYFMNGDHIQGITKL